MTDETLTRLLDELADDHGGPLSFTAADLARQGRSVRRRRSAVAGGGATLALAAALVVVLGAGSGSPATQVVDPGGEPTSAPSAPEPSSQDGSPSARDLAVARACTALEPALAGWSLDSRVSDRYGTTAAFVSPDGARWRVCSLEADGGRAPAGPGVSESWPLDTTPVPDPWPQPDSGIAYADECPKDGPATCSAVLYAGAFPLREGIASVHVETPGGRVVVARTGTSTYVVRFTEARVADPLPPVVATLRDADGEQVVRYDYNALLR